MEDKVPVKVIFLTTGDGNPSLFWRDKKIEFSAAKFVNTGLERRNEAVEAIRHLGGNEKDLIFLGYPDNNLSTMYQNLKKLVFSRTTKLSCSPYQFSFKKNREYRGGNLIDDLKEIILKFKPTIIISPHRYDYHPDHRAGFFFLKKAIKESHWQGKIYQYLIHYRWLGFFRIYPGKKKLYEKQMILYPPESLWKEETWFSFWLKHEQRQKKRLALRAYKSQLLAPNLRWFLPSFLAQNEIFQAVSSF